ncbi:uncharacterized protein LOC124402619 [Silurus meridionalis]|uniref:uncharacterized protein LOC124402619 n=1 Tax=Silurus meridionalis TaxID=175797 RepID=UPI001EEB2227|nr:uncharacterized protein LOC124402619 [Silurus meridionalis]XP_046731715.1 uncharacterized protein LOC124402619 [Silurus meridionalis]
MSEQPSNESLRPQHRIEPPPHLKDYTVQYPMQQSCGQEEETQQNTIRDHYSVLLPDYSDFLPSSSHADDIDANARATSTPHWDVNIQPDRPWLTIQPFESDGEEEPLLQEDEAEPHCWHKSKLQELEMENRQLREAQMATQEELRQFKILYKDMQNLTVNLQAALLALQPQQVKETPVPLPANIYKPPAAVKPGPAPYIQRPTPCRPQVLPRKSRLKSEADTYVYGTSPQPAADPNLLYSSLTGWLQRTESPQTSYKGLHPTIPNFTCPDPGEFAHFKLALENILPADASELFKYQVLVERLRFAEARLIADSFLNSPRPYTDTMTALTDRFGVPSQLAFTEIAAAMNAPDVQPGDVAGFNKFALQIQALVGLLKSLGSKGYAELQCRSHVARLLTKLPADLCASFRKHLPHQNTYTLPDLAEWLKLESWCQDYKSTNQRKEQRRKMVQARPGPVAKPRLPSVLHGANQPPEAAPQVLTPSYQSEPAWGSEQIRVLCPYCNSTEHHLSQCTTFKAFTTEQMIKWIKDNKRCWKCGRSHIARNCTLKKPCRLCHGKHLQILHKVNMQQFGLPVPECLYL